MKEYEEEAKKEFIKLFSIKIKLRTWDATHFLLINFVNCFIQNTL